MKKVSDLIKFILGWYFTKRKTIQTRPTIHGYLGHRLDHYECMVFCCVRCEPMFDCLHTFRLNLKQDKSELTQNINVIWILGLDLMIWTHAVTKRKRERSSSFLFVSKWVQIIRSGPRIQITFIFCVISGLSSLRFSLNVCKQSNIGSQWTQQKTKTCAYNNLVCGLDLDDHE